LARRDLFSDRLQSLSRLNGVTVLFEYEVDENGNTVAKNWEWK